MYLHVHACIMILQQVNCVELYNKRVQCEQSIQQAWVTQEMNLIMWTNFEFSIYGDSTETWLRKMCCKTVNWIEMAQDRF
jgi:hypothetical protein